MTFEKSHRRWRAGFLLFQALEDGNHLAKIVFFPGCVKRWQRALLIFHSPRVPVDEDVETYAQNEQDERYNLHAAVLMAAQ